MVAENVVIDWCQQLLDDSGDFPALDECLEVIPGLESLSDLPAGTRIDLTLWWDNSADNPYNPNPNRDVGFGRPTTDEMGFGFMSFIEVEPVRYVAGDPIPEDPTGNR